MPAIALHTCDDAEHGDRCRYYSKHWWWLRTIRCACSCHTNSAATPENRAEEAR